jgi:hypothetical protein
MFLLPRGHNWGLSSISFLVGCVPDGFAAEVFFNFREMSILESNGADMIEHRDCSFAGD